MWINVNTSIAASQNRAFVLTENTMINKATLDVVVYISTGCIITKSRYFSVVRFCLFSCIINIYTPLL